MVIDLMHGLPTDAPTINDYSSLSPSSHDGRIKNVSSIIFHYIPLIMSSTHLLFRLLYTTVVRGSSSPCIARCGKVWSETAERRRQGGRHLIVDHGISVLGGSVWVILRTMVSSDMI
jgi:hypothetical protein